MSADEILQVESLVNSWVSAASPTTTAVMPLDQARAAGATAMFGEKYDDVVRVVSVPGVSMELCGGEMYGLRLLCGVYTLPMPAANAADFAYVSCVSANSRCLQWVSCTVVAVRTAPPVLCCCVCCRDSRVQHV